MAVSFDQARELFSIPPVRYAVGGVAALAGVAMTFVLAPSHAQPQVLAAAADLPPGTVLTTSDLRNVQSATPGAGAVAAGQESAYLGQTLRFGLPAGALLAPGDTGVFPPAGYVKTSLLLRPGQYPQDLTVGQKVGILPLGSDDSEASPAGQPQASTTTAASGSGGMITGELLALTPAGDSQSGMVAELLVSSDQAAEIAQAPGAALLGENGAGL